MPVARDPVNKLYMYKILFTSVNRLIDGVGGDGLGTFLHHGQKGNVNRRREGLTSADENNHKKSALSGSEPVPERPSARSLARLATHERLRITITWIDGHCALGLATGVVIGVPP